MDLDFSNSFLESQFLDELFLDSRLELALLESRQRVSTISRQACLGNGASMFMMLFLTFSPE